MKKIFALSIIHVASAALQTLCAGQIESATNKDFHNFSFYWENDIGFSDRYYTNGINFQYTANGNDWWVNYLQFEFLNLFVPENRQSFQTVSFGQNMYTSDFITNPNPPMNQHPYSGFLYLNAVSHLISENRLDSFGITLGIVGPESFAEQTQTTYHDLIGSDKPLGWHTQLQDEPGIILSYNHSERLFEYSVNQTGIMTDFIGSLGANLGNVITEGRIRGLWRIGFNLPKSFDVSSIDYAAANAPIYQTSQAPYWHSFIFAGATARFVGYDIALDGNTYRAKTHDTDSRPIVGEFMAGISNRYEYVQLDLTWRVRTADYYSQNYEPQYIWTFCAKIFW